MVPQKPYLALCRIARKLGGAIVTVKELPQAASHCPFECFLAIDWAAQRIYIEHEALEERDATFLGNLIHEMGHVFACQVPPKGSDEYRFFGWELTLARQVGIEAEWRLASSDYSVKSGDEFGSLTPADQNAILADRLRAARRRRLITQTNRVLSIRV